MQDLVYFKLAKSYITVFRESLGEIYQRFQHYGIFVEGCLQNQAAIVGALCHVNQLHNFISPFQESGQYYKGRSDRPPLLLLVTGRGRKSKLRLHLLEIFPMCSLQLLP